MENITGGIADCVDEIRKKAKFLERKGYVFKLSSEFIIKYSLKNSIIIVVYYGRYTDDPDVGIRFESTNNRPEQYSLGWFRNLKKFEEESKSIFNEQNDSEDKLTIILSLLEYLKKNFKEVTNIDFCREKSEKLNKILKEIHGNKN